MNNYKDTPFFINIITSVISIGKLAKSQMKYVLNDIMKHDNSDGILVVQRQWIKQI